MKTKIKLFIALSFIVTSIANTVIAQTWSQGSNEVRTGVPSGGLGIGATPTNGSLLFYNATNTNTVGIQSGTTSTTYSMTLPTAQGTAGDVLQNNGSGALSWTSVSGISNVYEASLLLHPSDITSLSTTPLDIVAAPGAGKYIEVISASAYMTYNTTPYTNNQGLVLVCAGAIQPQTYNGNILGSTITKGTIFSPANFGTSATLTQIIENAALQVGIFLNIGNPAGGDSDIIIKVMYRIVTI